MIIDFQIPYPILFNPLKHHLGYIKEFIDLRIKSDPDYDSGSLTRELKRLGTSVMDIYRGSLSVNDICLEVREFLEMKKISERESFSVWSGTGPADFRIISLSDGSQWTLKFNDHNHRYVHVFPARNSRHTFRVKSNTLKTAMLYNIIIGKDYITDDNLNKVRPLLGLSPVKDSMDIEAIYEMIESLRS
jgi:hypothetical protein